MRLHPLLHASAVAVALTATFDAPRLAAETLNAAVGLPPKNSTVLSYERFADYVAEHSDLKIKVFSMSLLSMKETSPGLRDGMADLGFVLPVYYPAEFSESNLVANLSMLSTAGRQVGAPGAVMTGAMTEYILECPDCIAEYSAQGQVFLGSMASASYVMLCNTPVQSVDDLKGKKLRSGSPNFSRWAERFGAISVSLSGNEQYEALSQGVIDCTMAAMSELTNNSLADVAKYVTTQVPGGVFSGAATANFNADVWRGLTAEQREVILKGMARMQADMTLGYQDLSDADAGTAAERGVTLLDPSEDLVAATNAFVQDDMAVIEQQFTDDYGVQNTGAKIARITELVEKWKGLVDAADGDVDALAQVYWDETYSKLDRASFGMN
ncbi:C4-dicarboxylate TRAP transporter substrate-binding protein [Pseudooceanicola aestuarii]|uniref:C4-dicarboxylate TRAP transporter substrate-binding protein n=1 Tax=Pseudooceanicola aestuarii TaxID=2697319 RepID=UPI0013D6E33E|nr:C4-dicarboxylate TRAP transporter substrate-binding protein [Pseudooceanicola aestuarii]